MFVLLRRRSGTRDPHSNAKTHEGGVQPAKRKPCDNTQREKREGLPKLERAGELKPRIAFRLPRRQATASRTRQGRVQQQRKEAKGKREGIVRVYVNVGNMVRSLTSAGVGLKQPERCKMGM